MALDLQSQGKLTYLCRSPAISLGMMVLGVFLSGCGGPTHPPTHAVSGIIRVGGSPVADAIVSFVPSSGQSPANGQTDDSGHFTLTSFLRGDGAMEGSYAVTIMKFEKGESTPVADVSDENYDPNVVSRPPRNLLDKKYANAQTSGLTATVVAGQENSFEFDLKK